MDTRNEPVCALCAISESLHQITQDALPDAEFWKLFSHKFITYDELMRKIANSLFVPYRFAMLQIANDVYVYYDN